ncbi:glycosyltransferase [Gemmata sp. JC673]|uniref:Glycosyltransferase n=1 Tax=Gemmata algarum TaxID=2975278 RepID=A0ABU5ETA4_9BACT|nr:glycosyltransferase family 2 protein [Gemmata algarum]MDY3557847.1 glycosyltransferase [Gemmata algarum]
MTVPLVSFLTPAYNAAAYLPDTVRSVLAQTHPRVEVIVVNDGSRDDTLAVARSFTDPRVKVIDQENRGQSAAENRAFREAQGEYVVHLDADDLISPNKVEVQVRRLAGAEPGCVSFHPWGRFVGHPRGTRAVPQPFWRDIAPVDLLTEMWEQHSMVQGGCYLLPRALVEQAGPWDESLSLINDFDFFPRVLARARAVLFCPDAFLHYRSGLASALSATKSDRAWDSAFRATLAGTGTLLAAGDTARSRKACSRVWEEFIFACYPAVPELRRRAREQVRALGGPHFSPQMGPKMRALARLVGWKLAKRIERLARRLTRAKKA